MARLPLSDACPPSATHWTTGIAALLAFMVALTLLRIFQPYGNNVVLSALFLIAATASVIFAVDVLWHKVHLRASTGMDFSYDDPSWRRTWTKFIGLLGSIALVGFLYWLFPEYHNSFYNEYYELLLNILPVWLLVALPYLYYVDRHMPRPYDGYWQMGCLLTFRWTDLSPAVAGRHLLGWLVKGFFLPLMFVYMCDDLNHFLTYNVSQLVDFKHCYDFLYGQFYFIDVTLAVTGYLMSLRIFDTHIRSSEPTMIGWVVALVCYQPFSALIFQRYLAYDTNYSWGTWLWHSPVAYSIWGSCILVLTAIYAWATVAFGARFSNLTHRGIITSGPYRWTKHPAYIAKNLSWWMISVPFLAQDSLVEALRHSLLLLGVNGIYILRAKTEEWHLSCDPTYVTYALWIEQHGLFRFLSHVPLLRHLGYKVPANIHHPGLHFN